MATNDQNPGTSGAAGAGSDSGAAQTQNRKIAGKFNSVEEAIEAIAHNQDQMFNSTREEVGAVKQLLERMMVAPVGSRGDEGSYDQGYRRGPEASRDDDIDPTEFLTSPGKVLRAREAKLIQQIEERVNQRNSAMIANAATVLRFQAQNPDLEEHENLVKGFLQETNPNDQLSKRLKDAAQRTRTYLAKLKGQDEGGHRESGRNPNADEYVEGVSSGASDRQAGGQGSSGNSQAAAPSADDELMAEIEARRKQKASRFAPPGGHKP